MNTYLQGVNIDINIPLLNDIGEDLDNVSKVTWILYDENEKLLTSGEVTDFDEELASVRVEAKYNLVDKDEQSEVRLLVATLMCDNEKSYTHKFYYILQSEAILQYGKNSILTYMQALKLTPTIATLVSWNSATEAQQKTALLNAFTNLSRLRLHRGCAGDDADYEAYRVIGSAPVTLTDFPEKAWAKFSTQFKKDFQLAQMMEAEYLLGGDGVEQLRHKGVMSYTVGEVKQFYRTSTPLEMGCCKDALRYVGRYIQYHSTIARA